MTKIKKISMVAVAILAVVGGIAAISAFEAHIVNVTAKIENALSVSPLKIEFGTVFPQEGLNEEFEISVSDSFKEQDRVNSVGYQILEKEKPLPGGGGNYPSLCEFLAEKIDGGIYQPGDAAIIDSTKEDKVTVELVPPCFEGKCEQGYEGPTLPTELEGETFGCDLWVEVSDISSAAAIWHFNEGTGKIAYDSSGNGNNGTLYSLGPNWVSGKYSWGLYFGGSKEYISIPHSPSLDITNQITIEAWINLEDLPQTYSAVVSKGASHPGSYMLHLDERSPTTFRVCPVFYIDGSYGNWQAGCSNNLNYGQWYHLAVTYDGSIEKTYVNGILQGQEIRGGNIDSTISIVEIGHDSRYSYGTRRLEGIIDEVRILNIAKTF